MYYNNQTQPQPYGNTYQIPAQPQTTTYVIDNHYSAKKESAKPRLTILFVIDIIIIVILIASTRIGWSKISSGYHYFDGEEINLLNTVYYYPSGYILILIIFSICFIFSHAIVMLVGLNKKKCNVKSMVALPTISFIASIVVLICAFKVIYYQVIDVYGGYDVTAEVTLGGGKDSETSVGTGVFIAAFILNIILVILNIVFKKKVEEDLCHHHCSDNRPLIA